MRGRLRGTIGAPPDRVAKSAHGYTWDGLLGTLTQAHIHLCMASVRGSTVECVASTMVHELAHRYGGAGGDTYCNWCDDGDCPRTLTPDDALDNADSYSSFAYKLWPLAVAAG